MRGDLLFYKGGRSISDRLIQWRTKGPFVHVEVDLGDGTAIGARLRTGVTRHQVDLSAVRFSLPTSRERIEAGIIWLRDHLGDPYSLADILNFVITLFIPRGPIVTQQHGFDCSDLVARYVEIAGGMNLGPLLDDPSLISPNDLARACGLV